MSDREVVIAKRYVTYLPEHAVVICRKCKYALHPGRRSIREHFYTIHKATTKAIRKSISKYTEKLSLNGVKDVMTPLNNTVDRIAELEICKGLECNACGYVSKARKTMMDHCYESHSYVLSKGIQWSRRRIQTFFPNRERKYFTVNIKHDGDESDSDSDDEDPYDENTTTSSLDRLLEASLLETERREEERR
jgi:uncharacterized C2H2 Zn-finger protein